MAILPGGNQHVLQNDKTSFLQIRCISPGIFSENPDSGRCDDLLSDGLRTGKDNLRLNATYENFAGNREGVMVSASFISALNGTISNKKRGNTIPF